MGFFRKITEKFKQGLSKSRESVMSAVGDLVRRRKKIDESFYEELEEILITSDMGVTTVMELIDNLREEARRQKVEDAEELIPLLSKQLVEMMGTEASQELAIQPGGLTVIMFVGVNGVGKTTTIGKMAQMFADQGKKVMLAAGDTFRAGAIEQLEVWAQRTGAEIVRHQQGSDAAAVMFDAIASARSKGMDVLLCDTAGRLHSNVNLMKELEKIRRVISREMPGAPHEVLLVLDATTGQNALNQAKLFGESVGVTGIVLTKLDGTAKGGIVVAIKNELDIPVKFVGLGEKVEDLQPFDPEAFVQALFDDARKAATDDK